MLSKFESCARVASVAGTSLVLAGLAALPLCAAAQDAKGAARVSATQAPANDTANQMVTRDAATGELRAVTPEEAKALQPRINVRVVRPTALMKAHTSGALGARLTDEFMSYAVMVKQADGSLMEVCYASREEAEAALKAQPAKPVNNLPTE